MTESENSLLWIQEQVGRQIMADCETVYADNEDYYVDGTAVFGWKKEVWGNENDG